MTRITKITTHNPFGSKIAWIDALKGKTVKLATPAPSRITKIGLPNELVVEIINRITRSINPIKNINGLPPIEYESASTDAFAFVIEG